MMKYYEVPLSPKAQRLTIALAGITYKLNIFWNDLAACWIVDIADKDGVALVSGIPMVTGSDLLAQYRYLGFVGSLIVQTDHDTYAVPTAENLGLEGHLFFAVEG